MKFFKFISFCFLIGFIFPAFGKDLLSPQACWKELPLQITADSFNSKEMVFQKKPDGFINFEEEVQGAGYGQAYTNQGCYTQLILYPIKSSDTVLDNPLRQEFLKSLSFTPLAIKTTVIDNHPVLSGGDVSALTSEKTEGIQYLSLMFYQGYFIKIRTSCLYTSTLEKDLQITFVQDLSENLIQIAYQHLKSCFE